MKPANANPDASWRSPPALRGGLLALLAAVLFGLSTPLVKHFGQGLGAFSTAALLYGGAAAVGWLLRQPLAREAALRRADLPRLLGMAGLGAVVGPVALAWGLQRTSGASASLILSLEALFTVLFAWRLYGETVGKSVALAMLLLLAGAMALVLEQGLTGQAQVLGLLAVLAATVAWGADNTLSRALAERDPAQVVLVKSGLGAGAAAVIAALAQEPLPGVGAAVALLLIGALGYGLSLRLYLLAQRAMGAARTGSVFAFAPFIGALAAFGTQLPSPMLLFGGALMLAGVLLHLAESHGHAHDHAALEHEHAHAHNDGHHLHAHDNGQNASAIHSHWHRHEPQRHDHAHTPDAHHQHTH